MKKEKERGRGKSDVRWREGRETCVGGKPHKSIIREQAIPPGMLAR